MAKLNMTGAVFHVGDDGMVVYSGQHGVLKAFPCAACGSTKAPNVSVESSADGLKWEAGTCQDCGAPARVVREPT